MGHMATLEPSLAGRWAWFHGTHGDTRALLCQEAGSGAVGHVAKPKPSCARRQGLAPWGTW
jgi:hypothetical protein